MQLLAKFKKIPYMGFRATLVSQVQKSENAQNAVACWETEETFDYHWDQLCLDCKCFGKGTDIKAKTLKSLKSGNAG